MIGNTLKIFLITKMFRGNPEEPLCVFIEKDLQQADLFFQNYAENYPVKENFVLILIGQFYKEFKSRNIIIKRIYKNTEKIREEYEQKKLKISDDILKQDKHNMVDNLISIFKGKLIKK